MCFFGTYTRMVLLQNILYMHMKLIHKGFTCEATRPWCFTGEADRSTRVILFVLLWLIYKQFLESDFKIS